MPPQFDYFLIYSSVDTTPATEIARKLENSGLKIWPPTTLSPSERDKDLNLTALENARQGLVLVGEQGLELNNPEFKLMLEKARTDETNQSFTGDRAFRLLLVTLPSFPTENLPTLNLPDLCRIEAINDERLSELGDLTQGTYRVEFAVAIEAEPENISVEVPITPPVTAKNTNKDKLMIGVALFLAIVLVFTFIQWQGVSRERDKLANQIGTKTQPQEVAAKKEIALAQSRELAANALAELNSNPDLSLLLATEALKRANTPEAETALRQAVAQPIPRPVKLVNYQPTSFSEGRNYILSADLKRLVTVTQATDSGKNGSVEVWSTESGAKLAQFSGINSTFMEATLSPDGTLLFLRRVAGANQMWEVASQRLLFELNGDFSPATFSPDSKYLTFNDQNKDQIISATTGAVITSVQNQTGNNDYFYQSAYFSPDSQNILTITGNTPRLWQSSTGKMVMEFKGHTKVLINAVFSPNGQYLATSSQDSTVKIWDVKSGIVLKDMENNGNSSYGLYFSPDSNLLAINSYPILQIVALNNRDPFLGYYNGYLQNWSADSKSFVMKPLNNSLEVYEINRFTPTFILNHPAPVLASGYTAKGQEVLTITSDGILRYWSLPKAEPLAEIGGEKAIIDAAYSPDSKYVAVGGKDNNVRVFDATTNQLVVALTGHTGRVNKVIFNPDGNLIASGSADGTVKIWKNSGELITTLKFSDKEVSALAFSTNGQTLAAGAEDGNIKLWQVTNWQEIGLLQGHKTSVTNFSFSPDGKRLVSGSNDESAIIWEVASGKLLHQLLGHKNNIYSTAFSPDGKLVVIGSADHSASVWEVSSGKLLFTLSGHTGIIWGVSFTPDGKQIITAGGDKRVGLWDSSNGSLIKQIGGDGDYYDGYNTYGRLGKISADNRFIVVSEKDNAQVWDITTNKQVANYTIPAEQVEFITISPDNKSIILGLSSGKSRVYECPACGTAPVLLQLAESKATRLFTEEEKALYLH